MPVDGAKGCIRAFTQSKRQYPQLKVILSIGGGGAGSENFAAVAADPVLTANFVETAKNLVDKFSLDGLDGTKSSICTFISLRTANILIILNPYL